MAGSLLPSGKVWSGSKSHNKPADRKSTRLNSSHLVISYAVFCLKKKNKRHYRPYVERRRDASRHPITRMQMFLLRYGIVDEICIHQLEKKRDDDLQSALVPALHSA